MTFGDYQDPVLVEERLGHEFRLVDRCVDNGKIHGSVEQVEHQ
ncbi:MAG: hypothetical protein R2735_04245 [Microthrixaceae bacterium]